MFLKIPPALKHRRFTLLWAGLLISVAGSQMQLWALLWHIRTLTNLPIAVSGIGIARFLPVLIFSLVAGLVADLYNRRTVMFITQIAMTLTAAALAYLTWTGQIHLWHIYALTAFQTVAASFDGPARQALVPNLVPQEDLPSAFSMMSIAQNVGAIVGPALSGIVISNLGQYDTYLFNAVSFLAVLAALIAMGPVKQEARPVVNPSQRGTSLQGIAMALTSIREGIHFILLRPIILASMLLDFFATFFSSANTLLPFVAQDVLKVGVIQYGWLSASQSIGAVTAGVIISQRRNIRRQGTLLLVAVVIFGLATTLFGMSGTFGLTMLALILVGASDSVSTILRNTIRQLQTPDYIRGRMTSINQIFFTGGPQLGEIEAGVVAQAFGTPVAIISGGIGCLVAVAIVAWRWPQLGRYNGDEPVMASSAAD
jgi:MFS family permease